MVPAQEPLVKICLLGTFEVRRGDRALLARDWPRKKAAALLKRLALERRLLKDQAIEFLWPEADPASAANNLYKTIHTLRQTLDTHLGQGAAEAIFSFEDGVLSLLPSAWVDAHEFERLCSTPEQHAADLEGALALYQGDLLPDDRYEEWTQLPRQALYRYQREARMALSTYRRNARDYTAAIQLLNPLLTYDPADESVHRELMRLYTLAGQRHEALRQYQVCVNALAAEIDVPLPRKPLPCIRRYSAVSLLRLLSRYRRPGRRPRWFPWKWSAAYPWSGAVPNSKNCAPGYILSGAVRAGQS